jgi:hypothetical protein
VEMRLNTDLGFPTGSASRDVDASASGIPDVARTVCSSASDITGSEMSPFPMTAVPLGAEVAEVAFVDAGDNMSAFRHAHVGHTQSPDLVNQRMRPADRLQLGHGFPVFLGPIKRANCGQSLASLHPKTAQSQNG